MSIIRIQGINEKEKGIIYEVDADSKPLGTGGMGQVFKGCRILANGVRTDVAIKFLFDDLPAHVIDRARREASIQIHNENLVEMFGFIQIDSIVSPGVVHERYHVVSELLHGVMLYDLLKGKTTDNSDVEIPFAQELYRQYKNDRQGFAIFIIKNVLSGIMALHDKGYVHRDIDPSNVMITSDGKVKIIDYGIAKQLSSLTTQDKQLTTAGQFMGKAAYAAPELVVGDVSHQKETTDIYAIGIMFFQLLTGCLPFDGATHEVLDMQLHQKMPLQEITRKQLRKIIGKATEKKQADRFQSAAEFRVAIEQLEKTIGEDRPMGNSGNILRNKKMIVAAAVTLLIIVGGIGGISWNRSVTRKEKENNERIRQEAIRAERIAKVKNEILDSRQPISQIDSISGMTIKSSALLVEEAKGYLLDPMKADSGLEILDKVIAKNYSSSSRAAYLKGRLYYEDEDLEQTIQSMKVNLTGKLDGNNRKAHEMIRLAVQLDTTSYEALYELGCDYLAGERRIGVPESRNIRKARDCFESGLRFATEQNDEEYIERFSRRIKDLGH